MTTIFCYPLTWTFQEVPGETLDDDTGLADAVVLSQDKLTLTVQYRHTSDADISWQGLSGPYSDAIAEGKVTLMGQEVGRMAWVYGNATKAVEVNYHDEEEANLALVVTLRDGSVTTVDDPEAASIYKSAIVELDQILGSLNAQRPDRPSCITGSAEATAAPACPAPTEPRGDVPLGTPDPAIWRRPSTQNVDAR